jgi:porphobilinogen deaminase
MSIRGNVPTRLQKLRDGVCQGVVLAAAGLERLALLHEPDLDYLFLEPEEMLPAGGQGIIAVEGRIGDRSSEMAAEISDETAALELETERYVLQLLNAGCHEAVGTLARVQGDKVTLQILREIQGVTVKKQGEAELGSRHALAQQLVSELKISTK